MEPVEVEPAREAQARLRQSSDEQQNGQGPRCTPATRHDIETGSRSGRDGVWLGGRDSNPDTMVQSHVSYRWTTSQQDGTQ